MPIYIKTVGAAPVLEVLSHRIVWALVLLLALTWRRGEMTAFRTALRPGRGLLILCVSTLGIALNWLIYIWAVVHGRLLDASLGYYINPLVNVLLGVVVLGERLERPVKVAVAIASVGVLWLTLRAGHVPWIALALAVSFGSYGLMRKLAPVGAVIGLTVETLLLLPLAGGYLVWAVSSGRAAFLSGHTSLDLLLLLAGPVTAVPLLCFAGAAQRLPLSTLGLLQYLSPTVQFLLAVLVYGEPFDAARAVAFGFIWTALVVFGIYSVRRGAPEPVIDAG
jgi:chloramphenicol-sensitive protein RarD